VDKNKIMCGALIETIVTAEFFGPEVELDDKKYWEKEENQSKYCGVLVEERRGQLVSLNSAELHQVALANGIKPEEIGVLENSFPGFMRSPGGVAEVNTKITVVMRLWLANTSVELLDRVNPAALPLTPAIVLEESNLLRGKNQTWVEMCCDGDHQRLTTLLDRCPRIPAVLATIAWAFAYLWLALILIAVPIGITNLLEVGEDDDRFHAADTIYAVLTAQFGISTILSSGGLVVLGPIIAPVLGYIARQCHDVQRSRQLRRRHFCLCMSISQASTASCDFLGCCGCGLLFLPFAIMIGFFVFGIWGIVYAMFAGLVLHTTFGAISATAEDEASLARLRARAGTQFFLAGQPERAIELLREGYARLQRFDGRDIAASFEPTSYLIQALVESESGQSTDSAEGYLADLDAAIARNNRISRWFWETFCATRCGRSLEPAPLAVEQGRLLMRRVEALTALRQTTSTLVQKCVTEAIAKGANEPFSALRGMPVPVVTAFEDEISSNHSYLTAEYCDLCECCATSNACLQRTFCTSHCKNSKIGPCAVAGLVGLMMLPVIDLGERTFILIGITAVYAFVPCCYINDYGKNDCVCKPVNVTGNFGCLCAALIWVATFAGCFVIFITVGLSGIRDCAYVIEWSAQPQGSSIEEFGVVGCYAASDTDSSQNHHFQSKVTVPLDMIGLVNGISQSKLIAATDVNVSGWSTFPGVQQHLRWESGASNGSNRWSFSGACTRCGVTCLTRNPVESNSDVEVSCGETFPSTGPTQSPQLVCAVPEVWSPNETWARSQFRGENPQINSLRPPVKGWERQVNGQWEDTDRTLLVHQGTPLAVLGVMLRLASNRFIAAAPYYENCGRRTWGRFFTYIGGTFWSNHSNPQPSNNVSEMVTWRYGGAWQCGVEDATDNTWSFSSQPNATECASSSESQWATGTNGVTGVWIMLFDSPFWSFDGKFTTSFLPITDYLGARAWFLTVTLGPVGLVVVAVAMLPCTVFYCCPSLETCTKCGARSKDSKPHPKQLAQYNRDNEKKRNGEFGNSLADYVETIEVEEKYCGFATIAATVCTTFALGIGLIFGLVVCCVKDARLDKRTIQLPRMGGAAPKHTPKHAALLGYTTTALHVDVRGRTKLPHQMSSSDDHTAHPQVLNRPADTVYHTTDLSQLLDNLSQLTSTVVLPAEPVAASLIEQGAQPEVASTRFDQAPAEYVAFDAAVLQPAAAASGPLQPTWVEAHGSGLTISTARRVLGLDPPFQGASGDDGRYEIDLDAPDNRRRPKWIPPKVGPDATVPLPWIERWAALSNDKCDGMHPDFTRFGVHTMKQLDTLYFVCMFAVIIILWVLLSIIWAFLFAVAVVILVRIALAQEGGWVVHGPSFVAQVYKKLQNDSDQTDDELREAAADLATRNDVVGVLFRSGVMPGSGGVGDGPLVRLADGRAVSYDELKDVHVPPSVKLVAQVFDGDTRFEIQYLVPGDSESTTGAAAVSTSCVRSCFDFEHLRSTTKEPLCIGEQRFPQRQDAFDKDTRAAMFNGWLNALLEQEGVGRTQLLGSTATALKVFFLVGSGSDQPQVEPQPIGEGLQQGVSGAVAV
jgi:hypothetical protein